MVKAVVAQLHKSNTTRRKCCCSDSTKFKYGSSSALMVFHRDLFSSLHNLACTFAVLENTCIVSALIFLAQTHLALVSPSPGGNP